MMARRRSVAPLWELGVARSVRRSFGRDNKKGAVRKRNQFKTTVMGEEHYTKRSTEMGQFIDPKRATTGSSWACARSIDQTKPPTG
jgi:hypothetical protein